MLISSTHAIEGHEISDYKGFVTVEAIMGTNMFRDIFASFRNFVGGRTKGYEKELDKARTIAMDCIINKASNLRANAIVGMSIQYQFFDVGEKSSGDLVMVTVSGTAVRI